jgi:hypothetical protein
MIRTLLQASFAREDLTRLLRLLEAFKATPLMRDSADDEESLNVFLTFLHLAPALVPELDRDQWSRLNDIMRVIEDQLKARGVIDQRPIAVTMIVLRFALGEAEIPRWLMAADIGPAMVQLDVPLAITADGQTLVEATDPRADRLWRAVGQEIPVTAFDGRDVPAWLQAALIHARQQQAERVACYHREVIALREKLLDKS